MSMFSIFQTPKVVVYFGAFLSVKVVSLGSVISRNLTRNALQLFEVWKSISLIYQIQLSLQSENIFSIVKSCLKVVILHVELFYAQYFSKLVSFAVDFIQNFLKTLQILKVKKNLHSDGHAQRFREKIEEMVKPSTFLSCKSTDTITLFHKYAPLLYIYQ